MRSTFSIRALQPEPRSRASQPSMRARSPIIWGAAGGIPAETDAPLATWREWATDVRGFALDSGHYLAEEAPEATAKALLDFFTRSQGSRESCRRSIAK